MQDYDEQELDLHRINQWREEVASTIRTRRPPTLLAGAVSTRSQSIASHQSIHRQALIQASANPQRHGYYTRKRKRDMDAGESAQQENRDARGCTGRRGRPPKNPGQTTKIPLKDHSAPSASVKRSSRSRSQSAKGKTFNQPKSITSIDMEYLETCDPPVLLRSLQQVKLAYGSLHEEAESLCVALHDIPLGVIPLSLKPLYDKDAATPRKSKNPPNSSYYLPPDKDPYPSARLDTLKAEVDLALEDAAYNHRFQAHERQWGLLATRLLGEFRHWPYAADCRVLNTETCPIEPNELHTKMSSGTMLIYGTELDDEEEPDTVSKMVDWSLGLELNMEEERIVSRAFSKIRPNECSLNQSLSYISRCPFFLDIEIKKSQPVKNPEVQLAIWESGALQKKRHHGWDTSLPMPAITIEGHNWTYYLFIVMNEDLVMMGPFSMGNTANLLGIWQIVYRLNILIKWGTTTYKAWFDNEVLSWAKRLAGLPLEEK
ncbi:MAG: hypothetical protein Q9214_000270 [Letrouitia sp. 1 TL-2023]